MLVSACTKRWNNIDVENRHGETRSEFVIYIHGGIFHIELLVYGRIWLKHG